MSMIYAALTGFTFMWALLGHCSWLFFICFAIAFAISLAIDWRYR